MTGVVGFEPYKNRALRADQDVWVYRNLMRGGVWYSLVQNGLVVGHAREVYLRAVTFKVRAGGHARFLRMGVKNVHAFVVGRLGTQATWEEHGERLSARYKPTESPWFGVVEPEGGWYYPMSHAKSAELTERGLHVRGAETFRAEGGGLEPGRSRASCG